MRLPIYLAAVVERQIPERLTEDVFVTGLLATKALKNGVAVINSLRLSSLCQAPASRCFYRFCSWREPADSN